MANTPISTNGNCSRRNSRPPNNLVNFMPIAETIFLLIILSLVVASVAWTVTQEELFRELNEYCSGRCSTAKTILGRKFFYVFTCEYCFSHWVTVLLLVITRFQLIFDDWRG